MQIITFHGDVETTSYFLIQIENSLERTDMRSVLSILMQKKRLRKGRMK